ncbi:MAG: peptidase C39 family protein, partial [Gammaproteobacteria bacterium]
MIRSAGLQDLESLVTIENQAFETDRFSRRSFRYLLTKANSLTLAYVSEGLVCGYVMLLFHTGTSLARLYSLAVHPGHQGRGIGRKLVEAAEVAAREHACISLRLEVRRDNLTSIRLYRDLGYRQFGEVPDYYEDHMDALRFEHSLAPQLNPELVKVPYYQQTLDFTCGPAALLMAMHTLQEKIPLERSQELKLWRESTSIFMTSGHGGCGPYGLALAAYKRGFDIEVFIKDEGTMFVDSVRSEEKKEVMRLVQEDFIAELSQLPVKITYATITVDDLERHFLAGGIPVV